MGRCSSLYTGVSSFAFNVTYYRDAVGLMCSLRSASCSLLMYYMDRCTIVERT